MFARRIENWQPKLPAPLPRGIEPEKLFHGYHWHQRWEIFQGVFTPGCNNVAMLCDNVGLPSDLRGKRILDIGAWHGCFSFECERRGAKEVIALSLEPDKHVGFSCLKKAVGSRVVCYKEESVYNLSKRKFGEFDIVLFLGVLYHLRYPLLAIDKIRQVCRDTVLIETHVIDDSFLLRENGDNSICPLEKIDSRLQQIPIWRFYQGDELARDPSNWFGPNIEAVLEAFNSAGFETRLTSKWGDRAAFAAKIKTGLNDALGKTYEAITAPNRRFLNL